MHSSHIRNELNNGKVFWEFISIYRQRLSQCRSLDEGKVFPNEIEFTRTASQCTEHTHSVSTATVQATKRKREKKLRKKAYRNQYQCNRVYCSSKCTSKAQCSNCCCCCLLLSAWRHSILHSWTWCSSGENRIHLNESQSSFARERKKQLREQKTLNTMHVLYNILTRWCCWCCWKWSNDRRKWRNCSLLFFSVFFSCSHRQIGSKTDILDKFKFSTPQKFF